jgi:hypothetical protein
MSQTHPDTVTITLPRERAEELSFALADLLCWHAGYASAKGDDNGNSPMGLNVARDFNIKLKSAIEAERHGHDQ